tara:strand:- start:279 stop:443 length:165 start_codon:yes stop_codon:yes gene_type:complete
MKIGDHGPFRFNLEDLSSKLTNSNNSNHDNQIEESRSQLTKFANEICKLPKFIG